MPHCAAFGCHNQAKNKKDLSISFHSFPKDKKLRDVWVKAVGRTSLPKDARLCSKHFATECFDVGTRLANELVMGASYRNKLKRGSIPSIFPHKQKCIGRESSIKRAEKLQRHEVLERILITPDRPEHQLEGTIECLDIDIVNDNLVEEEIVEIEQIQPVKMCAIPTSTCDATTQTDPEPRPVMCDASCNFPLDSSEAIISEHSYCFGTRIPRHESYVEAEESSSEYDSQIELFSVEDSDNNDHENMCEVEEEVIEVACSSQASSQSSHSLYNPDSQDDIDSQDEVEKTEQNDSKERVFLVYESKLKELLRFCPTCGSVILQDLITEVQNEGSQLSLNLSCINGCSFKWQSQPLLTGTRGEGNLLLTTGIFFSGIPFAKFENFSYVINFKSINKDTYYGLRENFVFPVVRQKWQSEQNAVFTDLQSRNREISLAGDGRCDSPGHCAKYCTYTLLDVECQKIVDFKVVSVSEVANSCRMEKKGFIDTLTNIESKNVSVHTVSTDRHPQIAKEMRENHQNKDHQFDPWHMAKSLSKKLTAAAKKKHCEILIGWIPSILHHFYWSAANCNNDPEILLEKWSSVIHHITNRHEWPGNRYFHQCEHGELPPEVERKKKWLKPGCDAHKSLVAIVNDKRFLKDMKHLTKFVHTTGLEVYHSMYLKYLPKLTHFTLECMEVGSMLAALDHNYNVMRPQAVIQEGEHKGEGCFKIAWSKVSKTFGASPVLEKKSYVYLQEMVKDSISLAMAGEKHKADKARHGVMAPVERPDRQEIIDKRIELSRFN